VADLAYHAEHLHAAPVTLFDDLGRDAESGHEHRNVLVVYDFHLRFKHVGQRHQEIDTERPVGYRFDGLDLLAQKVGFHGGRSEHAHSAGL